MRFGVNKKWGFYALLFPLLFGFLFFTNKVHAQDVNPQYISGYTTSYVSDVRSLDVADLVWSNCGGIRPYLFDADGNLVPESGSPIAGLSSVGNENLNPAGDTGVYTNTTTGYSASPMRLGVLFDINEADKGKKFTIVHLDGGFCSPPVTWSDVYGAGLTLAQVHSAYSGMEHYAEWTINSNYAPPGATISFTIPQNGGISQDFGVWKATTTLSGCPYTLTVNYGLESSTLNYSDTRSGSLCVENYPSAPKSRALFFPPLLKPVWYAQAHITNGVESATSSIISFTIDPQYGVTPEGSTSTVPTAECNDYDFICRSINYMFYPRPDAFEPYYDLGDLISRKPPFGYFRLLNETLTDATSSEVMGDLMSSTTAQKFSAIFSPLRSGFTWLIWGSLGFYLLKRFIFIEL